MGYQPRWRLEVDEVTVAILEAAREENGAALVAVGSQGLRPASRMRLSSTSTKVVRAAPGAVLVYPQAR